MPLEETQSHTRDTPAYVPDPARRLGLVLPSFHDGLLEVVTLQRNSELSHLSFTSVLVNYVEAYFRLVLRSDPAAEKTVIEVPALEDPLVERPGR